MEAYNKLVDQVYSDTSFRSEFTSYVKLQSKLKDEEQKHPLQTGSDNDNTSIVHKCKRDISFLYTSLFKGLSANYKLDTEKTRLVILDVSDKYKQL